MPAATPTSAEGELLRLGLANADGDLRLRRDAAHQDDERDGERACHAGLQTISRHRNFLPINAYPPLPAGTNASFCGRLSASDAAGKAAVGLFSQADASRTGE
jgi:hypothetical protein